MSRKRFPRPRQIPPGVLHREADAEEVLTGFGEAVLSLPVTEQVAAWMLYALAADLQCWFDAPEARASASLSLDEALTWARFVHDLLPDRRRTRLPTSAQKPNRGGKAA